jgi:hypothetical protein
VTARESRCRDRLRSPACGRQMAAAETSYSPPKRKRPPLIKNCPTVPHPVSLGYSRQVPSGSMRVRCMLVSVLPGRKSAGSPGFAFGAAADRIADDLAAGAGRQGPQLTVQLTGQRRQPARQPQAARPEPVQPRGAGAAHRQRYHQAGAAPPRRHDAAGGRRAAAARCSCPATGPDPVGGLDAPARWCFSVSDGAKGRV